MIISDLGENLYRKQGVYRDSLKIYGGITMHIKKQSIAIICGILLFSFVTVVALAAQERPVLPSDMVIMNDRNQNWVDDLTQFKNAILDNHPRFWDEQVVYIPVGFGEDEEAQYLAWNEHPQNIAIGLEFEEHMNELIATVPDLSDFDILVAMRQAVAIIRDGHFSFGNRERVGFYEMPLQFRWFGSASEGGFYLVKSDELFASNLNERLISVNGKDIEEVKDVFYEIMSVENVYGLMYNMSFELTNLFALHAANLVKNNYTHFTLVDSDGNETTISLNHYDVIANHETVDLVDARNEGNLPLFLSTQMKNTFEIFDNGLLYIRLEMMAAIDVLLDQSLLEIDEDGYFAMEYKGEVHLVHIDHIGAMETQPFEERIVVRPNDFDLEDYTHLEGDELQEKSRLTWVVNPLIVEAMENGEITSAIIDIRGNGGGDPAPFYSLITFLAEHLEEGRLFSFFDQGSFSAAAMAPNYLEYFGAVSLGMPLSQNTIFHGFGGGVNEEIVPHHELRHSRLELAIPDALSHINEPWARIDVMGIELESFIDTITALEFYTIRPDIQIPLRIEHWINNYDPLLSHVINVLLAE